ncbi:hypothetical protein RT41_GL000659 [Lactococcus fujiensis JCM 16395]|uniref:Uncharacterized protein n=2 Tax=Lactococcus fujiensis TaxID=610251 RepID=A0A2A5RND6_9LACT|nr:hypothetical protein RT41_GL000659 [Lactococcus fujiensis JCM 16395]
MMKWQGFYLSEHTTAMREWREAELLPVIHDELTPEEKFLLLSQSMLNQFALVLRIKPGRISDEVTGIVRELLNQDEIMIEVSKNNFRRLEVMNIISIKKADSWQTDDFQGMN